MGGPSPTAANRGDRPGDVHQKLEATLKQHSLIIVLIALSVLTTVFIGAAWIGNWLRSPENFYLLPRDADDWSGWGTGMGALGTTGALIYAAMKFRSDAEEQRNLRMDRDAEARADAKPLRVEVSLSYPTEDEGVS